MRDFLTVLAVALIAALVVALAGPHFIDWTSQRARIDMALGEALGLEVETRGAIELRLLPSPVLQLDAASVRGLRRVGDIGQPGSAPSAAIGEDAPRPLLSTGKLRVELALMPLLGGKWQITDASIDRPVLQLVWPGQGVTAGVIAPGAPASIYAGPAVEPSLDALRISNGVLIVTDGSGAPRFRRDGINANLQAATLRGPWRASGSLGDIPFNLATGELAQNGVIRVRASAGEPAHGRVEFDGQANLPAATSKGRNGSQAMSNADVMAETPGASGRISYLRLLAAAPEPIDPRKNPAPRINLTADVTLAGAVFDAKKIRLELGDPNAPMRFEGQGGGPTGAGKALEFDLQARRLDITTVMHAPRDQHLYAGSALTSAVDALTAHVAPLPPINLRLGAEAIAWGDEEAGPAALSLRLADGAVMVSDGRVALPGASTLTVSGDLRARPRPFIALDARLGAPQPALLAPWLRRLGVSDAVAGWVGRQQSLTLAAGIGLSRDIMAVHGLKLQTAAGDLTGMIASRAGDVRTPARFDAQLSARGLDLAALPSGLWSSDALGNYIFHDEDGHVDAALTFTGERLRFGASPAAGSVALRASRTRQGTEIADLSVINMGGIDIAASGSLSGSGKPLSGKITASGVAPLASLAEIVLLPGGQSSGAAPWTWLLQKLRTPALARQVQIGFTTGVEPGGATLVFNGELAADQSLLPPGGVAAAPFARGEGRLVFVQPDRAGAPRLASGSISLHGANATPLFAALSGAAGQSPWPGLAAEPWRARIDLADEAGCVRAHVAVDTAGAHLTLAPEAGGAQLQLAADAASMLSRTVGLAFGLPQAGASGLKLDGHLAWAVASQPWRLDFNGSAGGGPVSGIVSALGDRGVAADIQLERLSLPVLAQTLVLGPMPAGDAMWSSRRFAAAPSLSGDPGIDTTPALEVSLKARRLELGAGISVAGANLGLSSLGDGVRFALAPASLDISGQGRGQANGGTLAGTMLLRRQGGAAAMTADVRLTDAQLGAWGIRGLEGVVALDLRFGASGESMAGLAANLAGNGEARLRHGRLLQVAPGAPAAVVRRLSGDIKALSGNSLLVAVGEQLNAGSFALGDIKAPVVVSGGVARIDAPAITDATGVFDSEVAIDLRTLTIAAIGRLSAVSAAAPWKGAPPAVAIDWRGPLAAPVRSVGVSELQAGLAAIRLEDELQRVEAWKAEARRLQEQDRRRREDQAREQTLQLEQQRKARENAAGPASGDGNGALPQVVPVPLPPVRPGPNLAPTPRFP